MVRWELVIVALALCLASCYGEQKIHDYCTADNCPPCASDAECVIVSNTCHESASCVHVDVGLAVTQEGCNLHYDRPPDSKCRCVEHMCRSKDPD